VSEQMTPEGSAPEEAAVDTAETQAPAAPATPNPATAADEPRAEARGRRKVRVGVVVSDKMDKTVLVRIDRRVRHPLYKKTIARANKLAAHDENNDAHVGDLVRVVETRPLSKSKRWRLLEIVERAK
jgi:small subunit ribosomal protein S17